MVISPALRLEALKGTRVYCKICDTSFISFLPFGTIMRPNAECPQCHSLERVQKFFPAIRIAERRMKKLSLMKVIAYLV